MGKRGPAPKPTIIKIAKGERKDRINTSEPIPLRHNNYQPKVELNDEMQIHFSELVERLNRQRVLTENDIDMLTTYVIEYWHYVDSHRKVMSAGSKIRKTETGYYQVNPYLHLMKQHYKTFSDIAKHFGFTPSSRSGISTNESQGKSYFDSLRKAQ